MTDPQPNPPHKLSAYLTTTPTPLLLDGALATYLESLGADISSSLWSASILLTSPELIERTHSDYFRAGAHVAITASYQASIPGLIAGLQISEYEAHEIVKKSVELAKSARAAFPERTLFIAGSVGPYGAYLADGSEYRGDYALSKSEFQDFHRGRIAALIDAGVDVLACETMPSKSEVVALLELLEEEFPGTEAWFTLTLKDSTHISDGTPLSEVAELFRDASQVVGLGFNCVKDELVVNALRTLGKCTSKPLIVYPNSGESWNAGKREWEGERAEGESLKEKTRGWWDAGARIIGGCCRTGPEDIRVMCEALEGMGR